MEMKKREMNLFLKKKNEELELYLRSALRSEELII